MGSRLTTHSEKGHGDDNGDDGDANERFLTKTSRCGLPPLTSWKARPSELDETYWLKLKEVTFGGNLMIRRIRIIVVIIILLTQQNSDVITISIVILYGQSHHNHHTEKVYEKVDDIDLMLGGVAEKNVRGGAVGATFACIIGGPCMHDGDDDNECCPTRRAIQETEIWRPIFLHTHRE